MLLLNSEPPATTDASVPDGGTARPPAALVPRLPPVRTLPELAAALADAERQERPDEVVALRELRMDEDGRLRLPGTGAFSPTPWARGQLAERLGIRWDRWFSSATDGERAAEVNLRLGRSGLSVRLRTADVRDAESGRISPVLRALLTPSYSALSDASLAADLAEVFRGAGARVTRLSYTDMTLSYALSVGEPFRPGGDARVGDLQGGVIVRNSGVGYASLKVSAYLLRLVCLNGNDDARGRPDARLRGPPRQARGDGPRAPRGEREADGRPRGRGRRAPPRRAARPRL